MKDYVKSSDTKLLIIIPVICGHFLCYLMYEDFFN